MMINNNDFNLLEELIFGEKFNKKVNNLPQNLKILIFGYEFNQEVNNLPNIQNI